MSKHRQFEEFSDEELLTMYASDANHNRRGSDPSRAFRRERRQDRDFTRNRRRTRRSARQRKGYDL